jgi:hypothetical protein
MVTAESLLREALASLPLGESTEQTRKLLDAALHEWLQSQTPVRRPICSCCHCRYCRSERMLKEFGW